LAKIAIVYYSSTGNTYQVAQAAAEGARATGAEVRVLRVPELAPDSAIDSNPAWRAHVDATKDVPVATPDDMEWADGYILGTPTRFGLPTAQMKQFIDTLGGKWFTGKLANKAAAAFTGAQNAHGGQESTLLALQNVFYHWGSVLVPVGYTDPLLFAAGGNPYGVSFTDAKGDALSDEKLAAARYMGARVAKFAAVLSENAGRL
jgi:NAD(P)H dehydrogenase (quinone)